MVNMMLPKVSNQSFKDAVPGEWTAAEMRFLYELTGSMDVSGDNSQNGNVSSIPDVWAKPLLFKMFMFGEASQVQEKDSNQPAMVGKFAEALRVRVTGEWRCILAMLALKNVKHLNISAEAVEIDPDNGGLEKILYDMRPQDTIDPKTSWTSLYIIKVNDIPFAMTSPATLVAVSAEYYNLLAGELGEPWTEKQGNGVSLVDPTLRLSRKDRAYLYSWLSDLRTNLKGNTNSSYGKLDQCIRSYMEDIKLAGMDTCTFKAVDSELEMYKGVFFYLNNTVAVEEGSIEDSSVKVITSTEYGEKNGLLLIDPKTLEQMSLTWRVDKTQLSVGSGYYANNITEDMLRDSKRNVLGNAPLKDAMWVRPDDFFTEHVYMLISEGTTIFKNVWDPGAQDKELRENGLSVVPPIKKWVLDYFSADDIKHRFRVEFKEDGTLIASFVLSFSYQDKFGDTKERELKIEKRYYETDEDHYMVDETLPIAELWPNVRIENWDKYYFCYINPYAGAKSELAENMLLFSPLNSNNEAKDFKGSTIDGLTNKYNVQLKGMPKALLCQVNWRKPSGGISSVEDVGILLINQPKPEPRVDDTPWRIGIDFGTSNTMLYYRDGNKAPKPLVFEDNLYPFLEIKESIRTLHMINNFIWPESKKRNGSFLTVYNVLNPDITDRERVVPLMDGSICSLTFDADIIKAVSANIVPNLKWDTSTKRKRQAEAYLEQICIQSSLEAAKKGAAGIDWNFSYPTAFSRLETKQFESIASSAVNNATIDTPFAASSKVKGLSMESVATAMYFNKLENDSGSNFVGGAICLDIGAGTTDLTVISAESQHPRIVYHSSIQYAGRVMFNPIFAWLESYLKNEAFANEFSAIEDPDRLRAVLDAAMREKGDQYMEAAADLLMGEKNGREAMENVLQVSQMALAGLFYYVGTILWVLKEYNLFEEETVPDIYIGGNGSRIIHWVSGATEKYEGDEHLELLKRAIMAGADMGEGDGFDIKLSQYPKIEVASGMLYDNTNIDWFNEKAINRSLFGELMDNEVAIGSVVAGESFQVAGEQVSAVEFMNSADIQSGVKVQALPEIDNLVSIFNQKKLERWGDDINIDGYRKQLLKKTAGYYLNERALSSEEIRVEPVFIVAMKYLVEMMLKELSSTAGGK